MSWHVVLQQPIIKNDLSKASAMGKIIPGYKKKKKEKNNVL